jgi:hypothetical protein
MKLLLIMASCALVAGVAAYVLAESGQLTLVGGWGDSVPNIRHSRFLADLWAHNASYLSGIVGGITVAVVTYRRRTGVLVGAA